MCCYVPYACHTRKSREQAGRKRARAYLKITVGSVKRRRDYVISGIELRMFYQENVAPSNSPQKTETRLKLFKNNRLELAVRSLGGTVYNDN